jgi:hypothetical protein
MNHKLLKMLNEAGFEFTPDIMAKLPAFENLVWLEREACAKVCEEMAKWHGDLVTAAYETAADAIRARGLDNLNKEAEKNGEDL